MKIDPTRIRIYLIGRIFNNTVPNNTLNKVGIIKATAALKKIDQGELNLVTKPITS